MKNACDSTPLVTVGVALYNHEHYIHQCLESIVDQRYAPIELIVIDDGSTDDSYRVAERYLNSVDTLHTVRLSTRSNRGMCNTLNEIARAAKGKYISFIGSDDHWLPDKLMDQVDYLEAHPSDALVHSNSLRVDGNDRPIDTIDYSEKDHAGRLFEALVRRTGGINTPSHLYRVSVYDDIGYYDPDFGFEDTDFWLRLTKHHSVGYIDKVHTHYRWHGENYSAKQGLASGIFDDMIAILKKNVDDHDLRNRAINRICRKAVLRSLAAGDITRAAHFFRTLLVNNRTG